MTSWAASRLIALVAALASVSACGSVGNDPSSRAGAPAQQPTTTTTEPPLPGEPTDLAPAAGDVLGVVGIAFDDTLPVRAAPGADQAVVTTLDPLASNLVATGRARLLASARWFEVAVGGTTGWVDSRFVAYLGTTTDTTAEVVAELGRTSTAPTMLELGRIVAATAASTEDPVSRVTVTVAPTVGDLGEVTYDVVGLPDDAVYGVRLHVFATPGDGQLPGSAFTRGSQFTLKTVESTSLCRRGVTPDGLCV